MRKLFILFTALALSAFGQQATRGKGYIWCGQVKNSYGYGDTSLTTQSITNAPWKFSVDTVFVDSDGSGHYKKLGTGVQNAGDTSRAIQTRSPLYSTGPLGFYSFSGYRTSANDSGTFGVKPLCWSAGSKVLITSKNLGFDYYNSNGDTLWSPPIDSSAFGMERYLPSYCDSVKFVFTVKAIPGRSSDATKPTFLKRFAACVY